MIDHQPTVEPFFHSGHPRGPSVRAAPSGQPGQITDDPVHKSGMTASGQDSIGGFAEEPTQSMSGVDPPLPPTAHTRFEPGEIIADRFAVVRYIAAGGMGEVYEVEDRLLRGARVALKVILPAIANDPDSARRFEQEVILARKISHPNLCPIYDIARSKGPHVPFLFLTMKLIAGETLSARIKRPEPLSRMEKISIFRQLIDGLAAIHAGGIIHRDIKPNNVMLDLSGPETCVVIMDFGLARTHTAEETLGTRTVIAGTPGYMAPEIVNDGPSEATDLFALGVLLHQVFTGERPVVPSNGHSIGPSSALDAADVPIALKNAVREFLALEPKRRCDAFRLVQATSGSVRSIEGDEFSITPHNSPGKAISRRQFFVGSAAAAVVAAGGATWKWDQLQDLLHPLPSKRFVALLNWPAPDASMKATLLGVIDAIGNELARAEAFDRNLLVIAASNGAPVTPEQLNQTRESLGANLVLAASAKPGRKGEFRLALEVLDPSYSNPLRSRELRVSKEQESSLAEKAVRAAASLLDIHNYRPDRIQPGTSSPEAFAAFRDAEALRKLDNDAGLEQAIEKYKQAVELDPTYAVAQAKLAWAYLRAYALHNDPAALALASLNCKTAIQRDPELVDAHLGLSYVLQRAGDERGATEELSKALHLDPSNPHTLTYQANFYATENQWNLAEQTFARVLSLRPNYWLGHQELGVLLDVEGKYRDALIHFRAASLAAPRNALAVKNTGSVYLQLGQLAKASENLKKSYSMDPVSTTATALAELSRVQHLHAEALDYAEQAVRINPNSPEVWLELADVYLSAGRRVQADQAYHEAASYQEDELRTSPKDGPGWMCLALCRAKAAQNEAALTLIAKAEANHADDMDSQLLKIRIFEVAGKRGDALATLSRCLSRGPVQFQLQTMPDLEKLRTTVEYKSIVSSTASQDQS